MRIAMTGSSGLIGTSLRDALGARGDEVIRCVRGEPPPGEHAVVWDPTGGEIDVAGLEGIDALVNLAGEPLLGRWTERKRRRIRDSRVDGTRLLVDALRRLDDPPRVLVSGSAVGWYGTRRDEVLTESSARGNGFLADVCADWEDAARAAQDLGIRVVLLRTGLVQSPEADLVRIQLLPFRLGLGGKLGSGQQWFPWIHIDDYVRASLHLLDGDASGPVNLAAPNPVRQAQYAKTLGRVLRRPAALTVPRPAVALVFGRTAAEEMAMASQRVVPSRLTEELGFTFRYPELEPALRHLLDR